MIAERGGRVLAVDNRAIAQIARTAGAPDEKGAGILMEAKLGDSVSEGETLLSVFAKTNQRCKQAAELAEELQPISVGGRIGENMLIRQIKGVYRPGERFILER